MNVFELFAKIGLDTTEYDKGLQKSESDLSSFGAKISSFSSAIGNGVATAAKVGMAAVGAATTAITAFGASAVKTGMDFDSSMSQVAATMGFTKEQLNTAGSDAAQTYEKLRDFAQEMGRTTSFSASESAEALNYMALAGYNADEAMQMLPTVLDLAASGAMELGSASDMVTDTQSALGLSMEDTAKMVDQMAAAASNSNTSVAQLGDAMLTIGATAKNLKGGTVELSTVLGKLADNGIKGAQGGTHLRNMLLSLQTPSDKGAEALDKLGMSYKQMYDEAGNMRSLPEIFQEMSSKMEGMTQSSKDAIVSGVFNKEDLAAVNALLNTTSKEWDDLTVAITDSTGAASEMAKVQLDNLEGDVKLFQSALEGAKIAISDELTPSLREFVQFGSEGLSKITDAFAEGGLSKAMEVFGEVLSEGLNMIIEALPKAVDAGMQLLGALGQGLLNNLPVITDAAIKIVGELGNGFMQAVPAVLDAAAQIISILGGALVDNLPTIMSSAVQIIDFLADAFVNNLDLMIDTGLELLLAIAKGMGDNLPKIVDIVIKVNRKIGEAFIEYLPEIINVGIQILTSLGTGLINTIPVIVGEVKQIASTIMEKFGEVDWEKAGHDIIESIENGIESLKENIPELLKSIGEISGEWFTSVDWVQLGSDIIDFISDGVAAVVDLIPEILKAIGETGGEWIESVDWKQVGEDIINLIHDGIVYLVETIPKKLREIGELAMEWFRSVDWVKLGSDAIDFIVNGIAYVAERIPDLMKSIGETAAEWIRDIDWKQVGHDLISFILMGIDYLGNEVPRVMGEIALHAAEKIMEIDWIQLGQDIVMGIGEGINNLASAVADSLLDAAKGAMDAVEDFFDINSPSRKMMWIGEMIDKGFAEGIDDNSDEVIDQVKESFNFEDLISGPEIKISGKEAGGGQWGSMGGFVQNLTINAPEQLAPSEIARMTRNANREFVMQMRMV